MKGFFEPPSLDFRPKCVDTIYNDIGWEIIFCCILAFLWESRLPIHWNWSLCGLFLCSSNAPAPVSHMLLFKGTQTKWQITSASRVFECYGLPREKRAKVHSDFMKSNSAVMVCTVAFGTDSDKGVFPLFITVHIPKLILWINQTSDRYANARCRILAPCRYCSDNPSVYAQDTWKL